MSVERLAQGGILEFFDGSLWGQMGSVCSQVDYTSFCTILSNVLYKFCPDM